MFAGFRKHISRVTELGRFNGDRSLKAEDVFIPKQVHLPRSSAELVVEELVVVRPPRDLSDIEVSRNLQLPANRSERLPFNRLTFNALPRAGKRVRELAESMVGPAGNLHFFRSRGG